MIHDPESKLRPYLPWIVLAAVAAAVFAVYYPGLNGSFFLDDWNTLPKLGAYGPVDNFHTFISYITSGVSGPSGRPLALASFLLDAHSWPASPWSFKFTNVLLHLLNGGVLAWLLTKLGKAYGLTSRKAAWAAVLGAGLWLSHPLWVSTTLYAVQRMAILAAFFVICGLALYVTGRLRLRAGKARSGYALMTGGIVGGTLLGFFCKENAALLPLLALVLEITVLRGNKGSMLESPGTAEGVPASVEHRKPCLAFRVVFLWLPSIMLAGFLLWQLRHPGMLVPGRDFSVGERLLTEPRILVYYLYLLVIPHAWTHGLYTTVALSQGLLHPWTTLPAILLVLALLGAAFAIRRRWPLLAAAILFFFAGQLLESTTIPLELYYEHRNYLPAILFFWPLGVWWAQGPGKRSLRYSSVFVVFVLVLALTTLRTTLWGNPTRLSLTWMRLNPNSARAVVVGTDTLEAYGKNLLAYKYLYLASRRNPTSISIALARMGAACRLGNGRPARPALIYAAQHARTHMHLLYDTLNSRIDNGKTKCPGFGPHSMQVVVSNALKNHQSTRDRDIRQALYVLRGRLSLIQHKEEAAYSYFRKSLQIYATPDIVLIAGTYLLNAKQPYNARRLLREYQALPHRLPPVWTMRGLHRRWLLHIGWYQTSLRDLSHAIQQAVDEKTLTHPQKVLQPAATQGSTP